MNIKDVKCNFTKVCGIAYDIEDIRRVVKFCKKHTFKYYYIKHIADDEVSKEHYHFIIQSDSYHRFNLKSLLTDSFGINLFQKCANVGSYLRYMIHIDYADKKHYEIKKIVSNVSVETIFNLISDSAVDSDLSAYNAFIEICTLICERCLLSLREVIEYCNNNNIRYKTSWTFTFVHLLNVK